MTDFHDGIDRRRARRGALRAGLLASTMLALGVPALAQTVWEGSISDDWFDADNWSGGVPTGSTLVDIDTVTPNPTVIAGDDASGAIVRVGIEDAGSLTIEDGRTLNSTRGLVGVEGNSAGVVVVTGAGSEWVTSFSTTTTGIGDTAIHIGDSGAGELTVSNGGSVVAGSGGAFNGLTIGRQDGSDGEVLVTGADSLIEVRPRLIVGNVGDGLLRIEEGGRVTHVGGGGNQQSHIGYGGGTGRVEIRGAGSQWVMQNNMAVGDGRGGTGSRGEVLIEDGGYLSSAASFIGLAGDAEGEAVVRSGGVWENNGLELGTDDTSIGTLRIEAGGQVTGNYGGLGRRQNTVGTAEITGEDARWTITGATAAGPQSAAMTVGFEGFGLLALSNGGELSASTVEIASAASSEGDIVVGSLLNGGFTPDAPGVLNTTNLSFGSGDGRLTFNHSDTSGDYVFGANISGASGSIRHFSGVTNFTGSSGAFDGTTNVFGGTLLVTGALGGNTVVITDGRLGGTGTLGAVTIGDGGTIAPGESIGTLSLASVVFSPGSTFEVEVNDGGFAQGINNDFISVDTNAVINGGTVFVTAANGTDDGSSYTPGTYTILTAGSGVTGTFDDVTNDFAFLDFSLDYDANNVFLISEQSDPAAGFCLPGYTINQCNTGEGVESLGPGNDIYDTILTASAADAPGALDLLSGEVHATLRGALIADSRFPREAALDRMRSARGVGAGGAQATEQITDSMAVWAQGFGAQASWDSDGNAAAFRRNIGGLFLGADMLTEGDLRLGVFGGYSRSSFRVDDRLTSGSVATWHLGAYADAEIGNLGLRFGAAHAQHNIDAMRRTVSVEYSARTTQIFGEAGLSFEQGAAQLEPFARLAYVRHSSNGYTETDAPAALSGAPGRMSNLLSTFGVRASTQISLGENVADLSGLLGWQRAHGGLTPETRHAFAGGDAFTVFGLPMARDTLMLDLGASVRLNASAMLGLSYTGRFASGITDHGLRANFAMRF